MAFLKVSRVRQTFEQSSLEDPASYVRAKIRDLDLSGKIVAGQSVAVGCSSRGISNYSQIVRGTLEGLKEFGLRPFLFPAMGSHGAATAEGQRRVLEQYGLTEESLGVEIRSSLDTVNLGLTEDNVPVLVDGHAAAADHIVVVNRVKSHTEFTHEFESGLLKMLAIGMGKKDGATLYHKAFMVHGYPRTILAVAERTMSERSVLFGVGIIEDGYCNTAEIDVLQSERLVDGEIELLRLSKRMSPKLPFEDIDVLVIDEMGKDISGAGFDSKVVGRILMPLVSPEPESPRIKRIVVCDLTDVSQGNADGVGVADFITRRLHDKIDLEALYVNALAGSEPEHAKIPMTMPTDQSAVTAGTESIGAIAVEDLRLVRIKNTLRLDELLCSEALIKEVEEHPDLERVSGPFEMAFDPYGRMLEIDANE